MLENIISVIPNLFGLINLLTITFGVIIGITIGALPGLTATMAVALMLPFTFGMNSTTGLLLLTGLYFGGIYGGSITAILINTPGTPAATATALDGYPLAKEGKALKALQMALYSSFIGGIISFFALLFFAPQLAKLALRFGPAEYFMLAIFGLTVIVSVSQASLIKGLISGSMGLFVAIIGLDPLEGVPRFCFENINFYGGIQLIPALIGLFAVSQIILSIEQFSNHKAEIDTSLKTEGLSLNEFFNSIKHIIKSSLIGVVIGAIPGTGGAIAAFIAYNQAKRSSKNPDQFGKGSLEGIAAAESANNGTTGATFIPLLTLGVPGDIITAVILGAFMMQGLTPGPMLFVNHGDIVYGLIIGILLVNIAMLIIGSLTIKIYAKVIDIPSNILIPIISVLCVIGAFSIRNSIFDVYCIIIFGIIGYILPKFGFPLAPILIAIILGPMAESNLRRALIISKGSYTIFLESPFAIFFFILIILSLLLPVINKRREKN